MFSKSEALNWLKNNGYVFSKSKFYKDCKTGILKLEEDGNIIKDTLHSHLKESNIKGSKWSEKELLYLKNNYSDTLLQKISKKLGRSQATIRTHATILKLKRNRKHKIFNRICPVCKKIFIGKYKERKYCSNDCYRSDNKAKISPKICLNCGKIFIQSSLKPNTKFCSNQCYLLHIKNDDKICSVCNKQFHTRKSKARDGFQKYCSLKCYGLGKQKIKTGLCDICGCELTSKNKTHVTKVERCDVCQHILRKVYRYSLDTGIKDRTILRLAIVNFLAKQGLITTNNLKGKEYVCKDLRKTITMILKLNP